MILVGDIGGTYTRLALFQGKVKQIERKYLSGKYESLDKIVLEFLTEEKIKVERACFGVAGPVRDGICKTTNLPWIIDVNVLKRTLGITIVRLLNDLEAKAYGVDCLDTKDFASLQMGKVQEGNRAIIAAGTGLGEVGLVWDGKKYFPFACEGGHVDFAARNEEEFALFLYLKKKMEHVSYERVVSGPGLHLIFQFLIDTGRAKLSEQVKQEMEKQDPSKVISDWGMNEKDPACKQAFELFLSLYGGEAGNLALKFLALNGVYIAGGMASIILEKLKTDTFLSSFSNKGRFKDLLKSIPIWVILNDDVALFGAAAYVAGIS
ncbi:MAG TPA: glucokinase [Chlamydiales bacterium]|nr:glucokinase [Chlamydiales bacterium]